MGETSVGNAPAIPRQTGSPQNWAAHEKTLALPAFVTSSRVGVDDDLAKPPVIPQEPKKPVADDTRLTPTDRGMLVFVSLLLLIGTLAIVAMATLGR